MIKDYLNAGYPALCLLTQEPHRAQEMLLSDGWQFYSWDCLQGIIDLKAKKSINDVRDPAEAITWMNGIRESVMLMHNLHLFLDNPEVIQSIQNSVEIMKRLGSAIVMISPIILMKPEIEKFFHVIELPLPTEDELYSIQVNLGKSHNIKPNRKAARAARGLTLFETETAYSYSMMKMHYFSTKVISEAKGQMIKKSGLMEFWEPASIQDVGGLGQLKSYIENRARAYTPENDLPRLKGILLVGIPGTGKSLASKAVASILGWPLIRLDIGALKNSLVGESERRMRQVTHTIDAFGNAVIWIDEVEKAFAGTKSSGETDAGTTASMFGHFLTWMSETVTPILVMATANNISQLPPEFMRAGRFDATFFVDLPSTIERIEIIKIMNRKYSTTVPLEWSSKLMGYTGAEIEQLAKDSLFDGLEAAFHALIPMSQYMREEVQNLRDWSKTRARLANTPEQEPDEIRKIKLVK